MILALKTLAIFVVSAYGQTQGNDSTLRMNYESTSVFNSDGLTLPTFKTLPETSEDDKMDPLFLSDLKRGGYFLLPTSIIFIVINGFLLTILCAKWGQISDSDYRNSCLFCLYLTGADFVLSALVGLPVGIRLSFEEKYRENDSLVNYTNEIAFIIFEFLMALRMILIAALSVDRCLHIFRPFKYMVLATRMRINVISAFIFCFSIARIIPITYGFFSSDELVGLDCISYIDKAEMPGEHSDLRRAPFRCNLDVSGLKHKGLNEAEIILPGLITSVTWLAILFANLGILYLIVKKGTGFFSRQHREEMNRKLLKSCILIMLVTLVFAITNVPITYVKIASFLYMKKPYESGKVSHPTQFNLLILTFASLYFNPWLHVLRIRSIKEAVMGIKKRIMRAMSTHSTTVMPSPNPRLSKMSLQAMQTKRKSSAMTSTVREESPAAVRKGTKPNLEQVQEVEE